MTRRLYCFERKVRYEIAAESIGAAFETLQDREGPYDQEEFVFVGTKPMIKYPIFCVIK